MSGSEEEHLVSSLSFRKNEDDDAKEDGDVAAAGGAVKNREKEKEKMAKEKKMEFVNQNVQKSPSSSYKSLINIALSHHHFLTFSLNFFSFRTSWKARRTSLICRRQRPSDRHWEVRWTATRHRRVIFCILNFVGTINIHRILETFAEVYIILIIFSNDVIFKNSKSTRSISHLLLKVYMPS
ncbi:hypothetical protein CAEBREN_31984 [Caenorhabditis brenneri]|uniref:Uncharacterized protein n=1 Tax=Caenorhabditis brenneri TaxID=135651 RepID=G0P7K1_CAEBE|nr:hypothetical protein CAEBREN_31984 [Caenorhabditis brenneri]